MKTFDELYAELGAIWAQRPEGSRSVELWDAGIHAIGKKIVEEAAEVWMAAEHESDQELALEVSQLIYHLHILLHARGVPLEDVYRQL